MGICEAAFLCLSLVGATPGSGDEAPVGFLRAPPHAGGSIATIGARPGLLLTSTAAVAPDASQVLFAIYGGRLYFRNLNGFNPAWAGCCYNYYIELGTDEGKAMYSYFMMQYANRGRITFWKGSVEPGAVEQIGNFG